MCYNFVTIRKGEKIAPKTFEILVVVFFTKKYS